MRNRTKAGLLVGGLSLALVAPGCDPATAVTIPALIITNTWGVEDQDREFSFQSDDDGETHGSFDGTEFVQGSEVNTLTGTWAEGEVQFTTSDGSTYVGTFHDLPDQLVVSSSTETLTLVRGG